MINQFLADNSEEKIQAERFQAERFDDIMETLSADARNDASEIIAEFMKIKGIGAFGAKMLFMRLHDYLKKYSKLQLSAMLYGYQLVKLSKIKNAGDTKWKP